MPNVNGFMSWDSLWPAAVTHTRAGRKKVARESGHGNREKCMHRGRREIYLQHDAKNFQKISSERTERELQIVRLQMMVSVRRFFLLKTALGTQLNPGISTLNGRPLFEWAIAKLNPETAASIYGLQLRKRVRFYGVGWRIVVLREKSRRK